MFKNRLRKILIICFCIVFIFMSITTVIMAADVVHIHDCNTQDCSVCCFIKFSINFIKNIGILDFYILVMIVEIPLIQFLNQNVQKIQKQTLVELKVVQIK